MAAWGWAATGAGLAMASMVIEALSSFVGDGEEGGGKNEEL